MIKYCKQNKQISNQTIGMNYRLRCYPIKGLLLSLLSLLLLFLLVIVSKKNVFTSAVSDDIAITIYVIFTIAINVTITIVTMIITINLCIRNTNISDLLIIRPCSRCASPFLSRVKAHS